MATDLNKVVTVGYLQSYDRLIKQAYKSADNTLKTDLLGDIVTVSNSDVTIEPIEWDDASHTVVKDIGIDAENDIIVSAPTNDLTNMQYIYDYGILVKQHTGTKITVEWIYAKPTTNVVLHITSYSYSYS